MYKEQIEKLCELTGLSLNPSVRFAEIIRENELAELKREVEAKKQLLETLEEQNDSAKIQLETQEESNISYLEALKDDIKALKQKSKILTTYFSYIGTDEFVINKLKVDGDHYCKDFWLNLKPILDKARLVAEDLKKIDEMKKNCEELRNRCDQLRNEFDNVPMEVSH